MTGRHLIPGAVIAAAAAAASSAAAMPIRDVVRPTTQHQPGRLLPDHVDAVAHAATMRGIGAARTDRARG
jgi:hypothetical protein